MHPLEAYLKDLRDIRLSAGAVDPETPVPGVTTGQIRSELRVIAPIRKKGDGQLDHDAGDLAFGAERLGMSFDEMTELVGARCYDVYLNDRAYWRCIPSRVWNYTLGGYQVIKTQLPGRAAAGAAAEGGGIANIARRIGGFC